MSSQSLQQLQEEPFASMELYSTIYFNNTDYIKLTPTHWEQVSITSTFNNIEGGEIVFRRSRGRPRKERLRKPKKPRKPTLEN